MRKRNRRKGKKGKYTQGTIKFKIDQNMLGWSGREKIIRGYAQYNLATKSS